MTRVPRILFVFTFLLTAIAGSRAQQPRPVQMASLRPNQELRWQRVSPTVQQPDGPVLYQLVFTPGTPGTIAKFDTNPRHLVNSHITDNGGIVAIGSSGFTINVNTGFVNFVNGQTFPGAGTVTSVSASAPLSVNNGTTTPNVSLSGIVGIANGGTGLGSTGAAGNFLRSSGGAWTSAAIQFGDLPSLSGNYVDLGTDQVINGNKTFSNLISGNISGNAATATTATTAATANNALALGGNAAAAYSTTAQSDARYLQLTGGTLTGALNGTTANFSGTTNFGGDLTVGSNGGNVIVKNAVAVFAPNNNLGTTLNELAEVNAVGNGSVNTAGTSNTVGTIGIVIAGAGTSGSSPLATLAVTGTVPCSFDGPATAADYVVKSTTTGGMCHDAGTGYPSGAQTVGRVLSSTDPACSAPNCNTVLALYPGEQRAVAAPALGGDLSGTLSNALVTGLQGTPVASAAPAAGQVLRFSGTNWMPAAAATGTVTSVSNTDNFLTIASPTTTPVINLNTTNTDARYVLKAGDTMTGPLVLPANGLTVGGTQLVAGSGGVGIGTSTPESIAEIRQDANGTLGPVLSISNFGGSGGAAGAVDFRTYGNPIPEARVAAVDNSDFSANLVLLTKAPGAPDNTLLPRFTIQSNGDINVANNLTVQGNVNFSSGQTFPGTWSQHGNAGTNCTNTPCSTFLGTTDNRSFEVEVNSVRALRIEPAQFGTSNVIGGFPGNQTVGTVFAGTIAGGGSTFGGASPNKLTGPVSTVGGGQGNTATTRATVAGGNANTAGGDSSVVAGGSSNNAGGTNAAVGGGGNNTASGIQSTVAGGVVNSASADKATIAGGWSNTASGVQSSVGGGVGNTASGLNATVAGGSGNTASGIASTVAGGQNNTADADHSFAAGKFAFTNGHPGSFVWSDGSSPVFTRPTADNQFVAQAVGGFLFITGDDGAGRPDPAKTVTLAANSGIITFASGQTFPSTNGLRVDTSNSDNGTFGSGGANAANLLLFGGGNTGEGIGSQRTANGGGNGSNQFGLDFYTGFTNRMSIDGGGNVTVGELSIASSGIATFASGQTFPGTVTSVSNSDGFLSVTSPTTTPVVNLNTTNTDARYVKKAGDTMTGALALPLNGLTVGGHQLEAVGNNIGMAGDVIVGGRISLGIYIKTDTPNVSPWDEACSNANDVAIAGGAFTVGGGILRESRPTTSLAPGNTGIPSNSWRVSCSAAGIGDIACSQAYVVCLSHASP